METLELLDNGGSGGHIPAQPVLKITPSEGPCCMPIESQQTGTSSQPKYLPGGHRVDFHVHCDAGDEGSLRATTDSLSISAGQQIRQGHDVETWNSVAIYSKQEVDGSLSLRIIIFHPDWDEPLQIACLRSRPQDASGQAASLECDLEHKHL